MRLSEWRKTAPSKESLSNSVLAILRPVLVDMGAEADAHCWVCWGDDPDFRYSILAPTIAGLVTVAIRFSGPDGARATAKLVRWSKVSVSELSIEASDGHRIVAVQVESLVLKGVDDEADRICEFVLELIAGVENRIPQPISIAAMQSAGAVGAAPATPVEAPHTAALVDGPAASPPKAPAVAKAAPATPRAATRSAPKPKPAPKPAALIPMPVPTYAPTAVPGPMSPEPDAPAKPFAPTPIADRAAAAQRGDQPGSGSSVPTSERPGQDADPAEWIGPHTIEEPPGTEPDRPRRWTP
jgi:hypothetical protein